MVELDLEEGPVRLVVDGRIEAVKGADNSHQQIKLSTTTNFNNENTPPPVRGATVTVRDNHDREFNFTESANQPGLYEADDFLSEVGNTYILTIAYEGETYRASETLVAVAPIDSVYQGFQESNGFEEAGIRVLIDYTDPADADNYYYWEQFKNGDRLVDLEDGFENLDTDEFYNGQQIIGRRFSSEDDRDYETGDQVTVRQFGLSSPTYNYFSLLAEQIQSDGPFGTPPAQLRGNVENLTNPALYPLGYFYASEVAEAQIIIEDK